MKRKWICALLSILLLLCLVPMDAAAAQQDGELVILYEPLDLQKVYTLAASSHYLLEHGRVPRLPAVRCFFLLRGKPGRRIPGSACEAAAKRRAAQGIPLVFSLQYVLYCR